MAKQRKRRMDPKLVARQQDYEVEYIAEKMGVTRAAVRAAIRKVGHSRRKVYAELRGG